MPTKSFLLISPQKITRCIKTNSVNKPSEFCEVDVNQSAVRHYQSTLVLTCRDNVSALISRFGDIGDIPL